jgi:hypothetical protein
MSADADKSGWVGAVDQILARQDDLQRQLTLTWAACILIILLAMAAIAGGMLRSRPL